MTFSCKVVQGSPSMGFKDVTGPLTYEECVAYLKTHLSEVHFDSDEDSHYTDTLDIMNVETGRLMSYIL